MAARDKFGVVSYTMVLLASLSLAFFLLLGVLAVLW